MLIGRPADEPTPTRIRTGALAFITRSLKRITEAILASGGKALRWATQLHNALLLLSLGIYLAVRLFRLTGYPIYFFTDEAVQTVLAADFVRDGFRDFLGYLFPTFFQNVYEFNLSTSVYAQVVPYMLFGKSVFVTRATAMLLTVPGALAIGLSLRQVFRTRYPWLGILLLSATPAWFLHSRTAFETALMTSAYACFLYCYLLYRTRSPRYLYPALVFAAAVFYTYGPGEIIILGTGILLLVSDARYHWEQRKTLAWGMLLGVLLALPYVRFRLDLPGKHTEALRLIDSLWVQDVPLSQKLGTSLRYYLSGFSLDYWFLTNNHDLGRHVMGPYANLMTWTLPFVLGGIVLAVFRFRDSAYRAVLACVLAVPLGVAVAGGGITRLLSMVVPATILGALALDKLACLLARRIRPMVVGLALWLLLALLSVNLLRDAVVNGPLWNRNYGMDIPYGAPQVFGEVASLIQREPSDRVLVSPTWANGVDVLKRFFLPDDAPVDVGNADGYIAEKLPLDDHLLFVLTASEYEAVRASPKFTDVRVEKLIPYPDGTPGFYFIRMRYSDQADAIFEQERLERLKPITETLEVGGSVLTIQHPLFDSGGVQHIFDGDPYTLARGYEANPMVLSISFDSPRQLSGVDITTGSMQAAITVRLFPAAGGEPLVYGGTYRDLPMDPTISIGFPGAPAQVSRVEIEILHLTEPGAAKIHVREIHFR
jgi:4-amino-4-deoxy-L-arabinose transferase-like glycosyltransferase